MHGIDRLRSRGARFGRFGLIFGLLLLVMLTIAMTGRAESNGRHVLRAVAEQIQPYAVATEATDRIDLKILAVNDLHGGLDREQSINGQAVGGAAYLAAHIKTRAATARHAMIIGAGDMWGASSPLSALLDEEPTVRVMSQMGFVLNSPGNHEFDRGVDEFWRLTGGGCTDRGCFEGSHFKQISSNIIVASTGEPLLAPYFIQNVDGVPVAFIGAIHTHAPELNLAGTVDGLLFADPAYSINRYVHELQDRGVNAFVVVIHEGGWEDLQGQLEGPIVPIVEQLDPAVSVVISAHSHQIYALREDGKLVTQGFADGAAFVDIDLSIDRASGTIADATAKVVLTSHDGIAPDSDVTGILERADASLDSLIGREVGVASAQMSKLDPTAAGETTLGNLIADSQRWKTGADFAVMNLFSIRGAIDPGPVTWGDLYNVEAYRYDLATESLTGRQLYRLFNQQWTLGPDGQEIFRPLQPSGLRVSWDGSRPLGDRIVRLETADGRPLEMSASYTVAANAYIANGGDGYDELLSGDDRSYESTDVDALADYVQQLPQPFAAKIEGRLQRLQ